MSRATQDPATLRMASCTGLSPSVGRFSKRFHSPCFLRHRGPTTPEVPEHLRFGLFPVRSPLLGESFLFSLPAGTKMFQFPAFAHHISGVTGLQPAGLSHSEISGSKVICTSPKLIAAYHVLHRLQEPRHPPYALSYLLTVPISLRAVSAESCTFGKFTFSCSFFVISFKISKNLLCCPICQRSCADCSANCGEYRGRTDDLLHAMQAL